MYLKTVSDVHVTALTQLAPFTGRHTAESLSGYCDLAGLKRCNIMKKVNKEDFDPEVYEFYKPALEGPGFSAPFTVKDVGWLREDEVRRHAAHTDPYEVYEKFDKFIPRVNGDDGDPLMVRVYIPESVHREMSARRKQSDAGKNTGKAAVQCAAIGQAAASIRNRTANQSDADKNTDALFVRSETACPTAAASDKGGAPVILYFHGGGYIMGCVDDHDPLCGKLADACSAVVISVEYRLAPEFPFPACIDDAVLAAEWAYKNAKKFGGDPDRLMAGGDSSGANIAAVLALLGKESITEKAGNSSNAENAGNTRNASADAKVVKVPKLSGLILFYGVFGCVDLSESGSAKRFGQGDFVLPVSAMNEMMKLYVPDGADPDDIRLAPGRAEDLTGMPTSIVVTAEFDPLRDDGEEFARRLKAVGNDVELIRMDGMMHGFILYFQSFRRVEALIDRIGEKIRNM